MGDLARVAVALHHGYTTVESILLRVARALEQEEPQGPDWLEELLEEMGLELEGIRPPMLSPKSVAHLRILLGFRHFFRHAYSSELEPTRLAELRDHVVALRPLLRRDIDELDRFLEQLALAADD